MAHQTVAHWQVNSRVGGLNWVAGSLSVLGCAVSKFLFAEKGGLAGDLIVSPQDRAGWISRVFIVVVQGLVVVQTELQAVVQHAVTDPTQ